MHRGGQVPTWEFKTWDRQLHISVRKSYGGVVNIHSQRFDAQPRQAAVQVTTYRSVECLFVHFGDGGVFLALSFAICGRQAGKVRCPVVTAEMQQHSAAQNYWWTLRARSEQHRK